MVKSGTDEEVITVTREEWTNTKYSIDAETQEISETVAGVFKQYPLKTAWAITIHKSQGLTFEKAIVDAGAAFTHGQVYVALSRCKTLEGLVLGTPLRPGTLVNDHTVKQFSDDIAHRQPGQDQLSEARRTYYLQLLQDLFDYQPLLRRLQYTSRLFYEHLWKLYPELTEQFRVAREFCHNELAEVGNRFQVQLERMISQQKDYENNEQICERINKGVTYFLETQKNKLLPFWKIHIRK